MQTIDSVTQIPAYVTNTKLRAWVEEMIALCKPEQVHWCDSSQKV